MMTGTALSKFNSLITEIRKEEARSEIFSWFGNGPQGIQNAWPDGMPYRTNEPEAALLQREDLNELLDKIERLYIQLDQAEYERSNQQ